MFTLLRLYKFDADRFPEQFVSRPSPWYDYLSYVFPPNVPFRVFFRFMYYFPLVNIHVACVVAALHITVSFLTADGLSAF